MIFVDQENSGCNVCRLCQVVNKPEDDRDIEDTLLDKTDHFQWIPGLGSFVEGYSLVVSKDHALNTGCFDVDTIGELEVFIRKIAKVLREIYKKGSIVFEHGSMGNRNYAGSCIEHHHIHILPSDLSHIPKLLSDNFVNRGPMNSIRGLVEFNQNRVPYIYYMPPSGEHNVFEVQTLPRQYLRQVIAAECGYPQDWDWREKPFLGNIKSFVKKMKKITKGEINGKSRSF